MTNPERMKEIIAERLEKEQTEKREQTQYSTRDD